MLHMACAGADAGDAADSAPGILISAPGDSAEPQPAFVVSFPLSVGTFSVSGRLRVIPCSCCCC